MKQINLFIFLFVCSAVFAQPTLTYEIHALKNGVDNPMTYCNYAVPGAEGANVIWDFTSLKEKKDFVGHLSDADQPDFYLSNVQLEEFGVRFFYDVNENGIDQYGHLSKSGKSKLIYSTPFVKMRYPFSYQDENDAPFAGEYFLEDKSIGNVEGYSNIVADAWGTIVLPGKVVYENTLRVKTTKAYSFKLEKSSQEIETVTYRWYNSAHRYPLLVLIKTSIINNGGSKSVSYRAAYNANVALKSTMSAESVVTLGDITAYPNPVTESLTIELASGVNGEASISFTDISGKVVVPAFKRGVTKGENRLYIEDEISQLKEGLYIVNVRLGEDSYTQELSFKR